MLNPGQVIMAYVPFANSNEIKSRPAVVLFEELGNIIVAGITSNAKMKGIPLTKKEGAFKESVIKTNYIFTISEKMIKKKLFELSKEKKEKLYEELNKKIEKLKN